MPYNAPCRPTPLPARAQIPPGWRVWSHGNESAVFRTILGIERPSGVLLIERCCRRRESCGTCG